ALKPPFSGISSGVSGGASGRDGRELALWKIAWPSLEVMNSTSSSPAFGWGGFLVMPRRSGVTGAGGGGAQVTGAPFSALIAAWWLKICSAIGYSPAIT